MKIIYITTVSSTMNAFFKQHIEMLVKAGHSVDLACNDEGWPIDNFYKELGCVFHRIVFSRTPLSMDNARAYIQLRKLIADGNYDIVHCHTPNASVITRLVCRRFRQKTGLRVFYTAHGFHFYKGAPKLNWMVYYPVEKFCSRFTDKLITINQEDYALAKNKFKAKEVCYIPGVGIDISKFENVQVDRIRKRQEINVPEDAVLLISVGELIERKNHILVLQALTRIANEKVHYAIVGEGPLLPELQNFVKEHNIVHRVHFLGYRKDVAELYNVADLCCFPSFHEGLPVALMEAMACRLPVVCSCIRGNTDLIDADGGETVNSYDAEEWSRAIQMVLIDNMKQMGEVNHEKVKNFTNSSVLPIVKSIYES